MARDIWPYDQRQGGRVSNLEHEDLLSAFDDGILPDEPSGSMAVSLSGGNWQVAPGKILVAGHVIQVSDSPIQGALPVAAGQTRVSWICAFIDRSTSPWN